VLPDTIQYLNERAADETNWLSAFQEGRQHHAGVGLARQRVARSSAQLRLGDIPEEQARAKPLLDSAFRGSLSSMRRAAAAGPDRSPDSGRRDDSAPDTRRAARWRGPCGSDHRGIAAYSSSSSSGSK